MKEKHNASYVSIVSNISNKQGGQGAGAWDNRGEGAEGQKAKGSKDQEVGEERAGSGRTQNVS